VSKLQGDPLSFGFVPELAAKHLSKHPNLQILRKNCHPFWAVYSKASTMSIVGVIQVAHFVSF
jgi:hypothetical protein